MKKNYKIEDYLLLFLGASVIVIAILLLDGKYLEIPEETWMVGGSLNTKIFAIILIIMGVVSIGLCTFTLVNKKLLKEKSVYFKIKDDYNSDNIKKNLSNIGLNSDDINVEFFDETINIEYKKGIGCFYLMVDEKEIYLGYEYPDEYYDKMSDEELDRLPLIDLDESISTINITLEDLYKKFKMIILDNEDKLNY